MFSVRRSDQYIHERNPSRAVLHKCDAKAEPSPSCFSTDKVMPAQEAAFYKFAVGVISVVVGSVVVFGGAGAGIAYAVTKPNYDKALARNGAEVVDVFGTPCYLNSGVVTSGGQLHRTSAILVVQQNDSQAQAPLETETILVTFTDNDIVFSESPPVGLCGNPATFWILDGDASLDHDKAVHHKLTRPDQYALRGLALGILCLVGTTLLAGLGYYLCTEDRLS